MHPFTTAIQNADQDIRVHVNHHLHSGGYEKNITSEKVKVATYYLNF